jgi:hypothetical protein
MTRGRATFSKEYPNISTKDPRNCRSLGFPRFPVEGCGFGQLHVVLFEENHISDRGGRDEVGNPGSLGMTKRRGWLQGKSNCWMKQWLMNRGILQI